MIYLFIWLFQVIVAVLGLLIAVSQLSVAAIEI